MNSEDILSNLKTNFESFVNEVEKIYSHDPTTLDFVNNVKKEVLEDEEVNDRLVNFNNYINSSEEVFKLFMKSKIKLFSSKLEETNKVSLSIFGSKLPLKIIFNNREKPLKNKFWRFLQLFYLLVEHSKDDDKAFDKRIGKVTKLLSINEKSDLKNADTKNLTDRVKQDILNVNVNETTNNMIEDIVSSFQTSLDTNSENPFDCILDITQKISEKYSEKIDSGEIELDKMMTSITDTIPGIQNMVGNIKEEPKEKVIIDDNFSTDNVELGNKDKTEKGGFNLSGMMSMMNKMNGSGGGPNLKGLMDVMGKLNNVENEEDALKLKSEMDNYLEKELGVDVSKLNETIGKTNLNLNEEQEEEEQEQEQEQEEVQVQE